MTDIDTALKAIAQHKESLQAKIDLLEESDRNGDLVITMLVAALKQVMVSGATTKLRRDQCKSALAFAEAHLGVEAA